MSQKKHKPVHTPVEAEGPLNEGVTGMRGGHSNQEMLEQLFDRQRSTPVQAGRSGGMFQDLKYSLPQEMPGSQPGTMDRYNLSFRDKSGYRGSTSEAFMNKAGGGSKWKGLRLDHGPNVKTNGQTNWHWNQKGAMNAFGRPDHAVASPMTGRIAGALKGIKPAARGAMVVGAGMDAYSIGSEAHESMQTGNWDNTIDESARVAGGWAGAYGGAKAMGSLGAGLGTMIAPGIGTVVGGALGGFLGGVGGYMGGSALGQWAASKATQQ
jgi:hypothetical protein